MADQPVNRREYANWVNANSTGLTGCYWIIPSSLLNVYNVKMGSPLLGDPSSPLGWAHFITDSKHEF